MSNTMVRNIVEEQCTRCQGHTVVLNGAGLHVACPTCGGTGKSPVVNKEELAKEVNSFVDNLNKYKEGNP